MKRSKMQTIISNWLLNAAPKEYQIVSTYSRNIDADDLLKTIEEAGMKPPLILNQKYKGPLTGWEPENE